jgi:hypothetical protein
METMKRMMMAACAAATIALALPAVQSFADTGGPSTEQQEQWKQRREEWMQRRSEILDARLVGFKASLALTSEQEKAWPPFETALRDMAKLRGPGMGNNADRDGPPASPIDRMRAISERIGERSKVLGALADAAAPLYTTFDDKQKVVFNATLLGLLRPHHFGQEGPEGRRWDRRD